MYSKNRGITYGTPHIPGGRGPAYRQPDRPRMQVPANYSGHAIVDGEERPLGSTIEADPSEDTPSRTTPTPYFDDLPRVSELGDPHRRSKGVTIPADYEAQPEVSVPPVSADRQPEGGASPSVQAEAKPALLHGAHFPFGHGIGFEELLLLGLILFLLHENADRDDRFDRGDLDETVILLGLLLLLG